jgi:hypothetical protein
MHNGSKALFQAGLGLFRANESQILRLSEFDEVYQFLQKMPRSTPFESVLGVRLHHPFAQNLCSSPPTHSSHSHFWGIFFFCFFFVQAGWSIKLRKTYLTSLRKKYLPQQTKIQQHFYSPNSHEERELKSQKRKALFFKEGSLSEESDRWSDILQSSILFEKEEEEKEKEVADQRQPEEKKIEAPTTDKSVLEPEVNAEKTIEREKSFVTKEDHLESGEQIEEGEIPQLEAVEISVKYVRKRGSKLELN